MSKDFKNTKGKMFIEPFFLSFFVAVKHRLLPVIYLCFLPLFVPAQFIEIGGKGGALSFNGDINPDNIIANTEAAYGAFIRYTPHPHFSSQFHFVKGTLIANDRQSDRSDIKERNLNFKSDLMEFALLAEFNILPFDPWTKSRVLSPYIGTGLAYFMFNPQTKYNGSWVDLQPLGTEGQGLDGFSAPYHLHQFSVPLTAGLKYALGQRFCIALEFGYRFTFTDYIDDVSTIYLSPQTLQPNGDLAVALSNRTEEYTGIPADDRIGSRRGNSNTNDAYMIWGVSLSINISTIARIEKSSEQPYQLNKWL